MDLGDELRNLALRIEKQRSSVLTEEACKTAFVMPFIKALGYDVFDPQIVIPEYTADIGIKKGEKVDYAIRVNDKVAILVECKGCGSNLAQAHMSQLLRYFSVTEARFAILTNGIEYWFYSDLDEPNKMDQRPFFIFNVIEYRAGDIIELKKFAQESFDVPTIISTASNLKYSSAIKIELLREFNCPSEEMIRLLVGRVFDGRFTQKIRDDFAPLVISAFKEAIRDRVSDRLTSALEVTTSGTSGQVMAPTNEIELTSSLASDKQNDEIVTTEEEIEAFHIVRAIVRTTIKSDRITLRDAKNYCAILIDNNNRRPLIRFHFNNKTVKYISIFDRDKVEEKIKIDSLDDIYAYADRLRETAEAYDKAKVNA